jgi:chromosome partitioning protein
MHVLALANQKGGCGKTTAAINLAGALASRGARALLVDLDPQGHATLGLSCSADVAHGVAEVLLGAAPLSAVLRSTPGGFDLAPANRALADYELEAERLIAPERRLATALTEVERRYDYVLVDCPPRADGVLTANAVRAARAVVLVVETGAFALQGALRARELFVELARELEHGVELWVLATLFDRRTRFARDVLVAMQARFGAAMFDCAIREHVRLREAAGFGVPVQVLDPRSRAAADFDALAREVEARAGAAARRAPAVLALEPARRRAPAPRPDPLAAGG